MSGNEPSRPTAGLHIAADSSVVVCLVGPALHLRARLYTFLKRDVLYIVGTSRRLTAGMKTTRAMPVTSDPPQNQTYDAENYYFKHWVQVQRGNCQNKHLFIITVSVS